MLGARTVRPEHWAVRVLPGLREQRRRRRARQAGRLRLPESTLYRRVVWSHWVNFVSKYIFMVPGVVGGVPGVETPRVADSSAAGASILGISTGSCC